jgi:hypothetical protein
MLHARRYGLPAQPVPEPPCWQRLAALLDGQERPTWNLAYEAEALLDWLAPDGNLPALFQDRIAEASTVLAAKRIDELQKQFGCAHDAGAQRLALRGLNEELHDHWAQEDERVDYYQRITSRTAWSVVVSMALLVLSFLTVRSQLSPTATATSLTPTLSSFRLLSVVIAAGLFGSCLSMLIGLRPRLDAASQSELKRMALWVHLLARATVGAGAALVVFAMGVATFLDGRLMPKLGEPIAFATFAHLVVLCILAGFSEKLVQDALTKVEGGPKDTNAPRVP